jgi:hypothetical protein
MDIVMSPLHTEYTALLYAHNNQNLIYICTMAFPLVHHCFSRKPHLVETYPATTLPSP